MWPPGGNNAQSWIYSGVSSQFLSVCPSAVCLGHTIEHLCCKMIHLDFYASSAYDCICSLVCCGKKALLFKFFIVFTVNIWRELWFYSTVRDIGQVEESATIMLKMNKKYSNVLALYIVLCFNGGDGTRGPDVLPQTPDQWLTMPVAAEAKARPAELDQRKIKGRCLWLLHFIKEFSRRLIYYHWITKQI